MTDNCPALNPRGAKNEDLIPCGEAVDRYGISIRHGKMQTNGELRFRLVCLDGTAYIRTQTPQDDQGWQNSHYHRHVRETYIVEGGWIGYAELRGEKVILRRYEAGDVFTTEPNVIHNIFMPSEAIIHTVKHGASKLPLGQKADWVGEDMDPRVAVLRRQLGKAFNGPTENPHVGPELLYNSAYRHFDTLIWQTPIWTTGFFAAMGASVTSDASKTFLGDFANALKVNATTLEAAILIFFSVFVAALGYALHRFRWHQIGTRPWPLDGLSSRLPPQAILQTLVTLEAVLLVTAAAVLLDGDAWILLVTALVTLFVVTGCAERKLMNREREVEPHRVRVTGVSAEHATTVQGAS